MDAVTSEAIGLLHPGEMGAAIGAALAAAGRRVLWASEGRGEATAARAAAAGLVDAGSVAALVERCGTVLSVCPPHAAVEVAGQVRAAGFSGRYVDANAVSPSTAREVASIVEAGGARYVDGGIIGAPPAPGRPVDLWLSGAGAGEAAALFEGTDVAARVAGGGALDASALKMCFAAWTKGTSALLLAIRALAASVGVEEELLDAWRGRSPELLAQGRRAAEQAATKGWRWVGEMEEIAETFRSARLPGGFHEAAADVYGRVGRDPLASADEATLEAVVASVRGAGRGDDGAPGGRAPGGRAPAEATSVAGAKEG